MKIINISFLLAFLLGQSVNAADETEVYSFSTDKPAPMAGRGMEVPEDLAKILGFNYISYDEHSQDSVYISNNTEKDLPQEWAGIIIGSANMNYRNYDKNYIFAKVATPQHFSGDESLRETHKGADVLSIIKKNILDESFEEFKKAHVVLDKQEFVRMVKDVDMVIKSIIIAKPVQALRALNKFFVSMETAHYSVGFKMPNTLVFVGREEAKGPLNALVIKLSPKAIRDIAEQAKEMARQAE